jgi:ribosomal protein S18 acetylase RimI-like enzyme
MANIRTIRSDDYEALQELEAEIFGKAGYPLVGSYYLRVCTELYTDSCFMALVDERPVGYVLTFLKDRTAYSTRLGVIDQHQGTGAAIQLIAATIETLVRRDFDVCWFTVKPSNLHARKLYRRIGAIERGTRQDFFTPGDELILLELDRPALQSFHEKYELLWGRNRTSAGQSCSQPVAI